MMFKPCLRTKYKFLRKAVGVKRELIKYSRMSFYHTEKSMEGFVGYGGVIKEVDQSLASESLSSDFSSAIRLRDGGYKHAMEILTHLRENNEEYGWGV